MQLISSAAIGQSPDPHHPERRGRRDWSSCETTGELSAVHGDVPSPDPASTVPAETITSRLNLPTATTAMGVAVVQLDRLSGFYKCGFLAIPAYRCGVFSRSLLRVFSDRFRWFHTIRTGDPRSSPFDRQ